MVGALGGMGIDRDYRLERGNYSSDFRADSLLELSQNARIGGRPVWFDRYFDWP